MISKVLSNKIYYATFTLAIFVIAIHVSYVDFLNPAVVGYDFSFFIQRFFIVIGDASVPTFFVISGYLLFSKFTLKFESIFFELFVLCLLLLLLFILFKSFNLESLKYELSSS